VFDQISRLAERTTVHLSRRRFLTQLGQGALAVTALLGATSTASAWWPKLVSCTLNGGCCTGVAPYLGGYQSKDGRIIYLCYDNSKCGGISYGCLRATCCNGGGYCTGMSCYADALCGTPC
jgi:hypothetical protein